MIIGHQKNLQFLTCALENEKLAHAYCFSGPDQVGKRTVAKYIAAKALNTESEKLGVHADYLYIERAVEEKTGKLKKDIIVSQAKIIGNFLQNRSWLGGKKIVIIDEAEKINIEAANALLKTLEESAENSLIILLTENDRNLPATVLSRCQQLNFSLVPEAEIAEALIQSGNVPETVKLAAEASWGRPGRAVELLNDKEKMSEYVSEIDRLEKIIGRPFFEKISATEDLFGDKEDAVRGRDKLKNILDLWTMLWRGVFSGNTVAGKYFSPGQTLKIIDEIKNARELLTRNIHPRLLIERILLII
ncbi:MAG: AAA family ATPase [Candidatus Magasanikbacteria bacterium]|nr:AAA family ATPase [Candidatus Magasanikbacteria bacterium]